jgi:hypothetical protein
MPLPYHARQQRTVEPHRRVQIPVKLRLPLMIGQRSKATTRRMRAADDIHEKIDAAHLLIELGHNGIDAAGCGDVSLNEQVRVLSIGQGRAGGCGDRCSTRDKSADDGLAHAFRAPCHQGALAGEFLGINSE